MATTIGPRSRVVLGVLGIALLVTGWWLLSLGFDPVRVPSPERVVDALIEGFGTISAITYITFRPAGIVDGLQFTLVNVLVGVSIGTLVGFALGIGLGSSEVARGLFQFPLLALSVTPLLVILPFILIWFGTARLAQSALVIFFTMVTMYTVTLRAAQAAWGPFASYAASLGASRWQTIRWVIVPAALPAAMGAVRVATALGWSFATVSELLGGNEGAGTIIKALGNVSATADILAVVLCLGTLAVLVDGLLSLIQRWALRWQETAT